MRILALRAWIFVIDALLHLWSVIMRPISRIRKALTGKGIADVDKDRYIEVADLGRMLKRGDRVRAKGSDGKPLPNVGVVMGVCVHMGKQRVAVQPYGKVETYIFSEDELVVCPDMDAREPIFAGANPRGTVSGKMLIPADAMRKQARARSVWARMARE